MSFGVAFRNALGLGLGGIVTLLTGTLNRGGGPAGDLLTESGDNLVQEDGGLIILEP